MQEIYNKEFMINKGCALPVTQKDLYSKINYLIENKEEYNKMVQCCKNTKKLYAVDKFYDALKDIQPANYNNLQLKDTKKQLIKKIKKQKKLDAKK